MEESLDKSQRQIGTLEGRLSLTQQALVMSFRPSINLGFLGSGFWCPTVVYFDQQTAASHGVC